MGNRENDAPLATFSLIFGLLCIPCFSCPLPMPLAIIFGHIALGHIGSSATQDARGRAWAGLLLGYMSLCGFGIFAVLIAIGAYVGTTDRVDVVPEEAGEILVETAPAFPPGADGPDQSDDVYLLEGDARYHRFFCSTTGDSDMQRTRLADAVDGGFRACEVCQPDSP